MNVVVVLGFFFCPVKAVFFKKKEGSILYALATLAIKTSTTLGSAKVEISPKESSSPAIIFLKILLINLPDLVFGKSSTK